MTQKIITIPFIPGDGIGPEIMQSTQKVTDATIAKIYGDDVKIHWHKLFASEESYEKYGTYLPATTIEDIIKYTIAIKGPMRTPTGGGHKSLNVALRKQLDLYACVRPIQYISGAPMPMKNPYGTDLTIFRENTDDVYQGIDYTMGQDDTKNLINLINKDGYNIPLDSGIAIKPISREKTHRIVEAAIQDTIKKGKKRITVMHKGNIQKQTEGAFARRAFEYVQEHYPDIICLRSTDESVDGVENYKKNRTLIKETNAVYMDELIADNTFAQMIKNPQQFDTIIAPNLNGDYISDAAAEVIGGLGVGGGININYNTGLAVAEAIHGTANDIAGQDKANAISLELSMALLLDHIGEKQAAQIIRKVIYEQIQDKVLTGDLMAVVNRNGLLIDQITQMRFEIQRANPTLPMKEIDHKVHQIVKSWDLNKILTNPTLVGTSQQTQDLISRINAL